MCDFQLVQGGFVPQGHTMNTALTRYLQYREGGGEPSRRGFIDWQIETHASAEGGAAANWYPLGPNQCGFGNICSADLGSITNDPDGFRAGQILRSIIPENIGDACQTVKSAYVVGVYRANNIQNDEIINDIVAHGWAGNANAARVILSVGSSFLKHFRLVDDGGMPNGRFVLLFGCAND